jgi:hypothetical protein
MNVSQSKGWKQMANLVDLVEAPAGHHRVHRFSVFTWQNLALLSTRGHHLFLFSFSNMNNIKTRKIKNH